MADTAAAPAAAPVDANLTAATDMLGWSDQEMAENMGLQTPAEADGEPSAEAVLEANVEVPTTVETPVKEPVKEPVKAEEPAPEPEPEPAKESEKKPVAEFQVFDKEGELEVPPDVTLTYKAAGKVRENVPLDRVVRLAQMGEYNEEREQRVAQSDQRVSQAEQQLAQQAETLRQNEAWFTRILSDENFRERALLNYAQENTPEAELQRLKQQNAERETREREQGEIQQAAAFVQANIAPRMTQLQEENPLVPFEEVLGRFNLVIAPYMVRGRVDNRHLPTVQHIVETDLAHWIQQQQQKRETDTQRVTNKVAAAQTKTTLAKRQLSRAQQPGQVTTKAAPKLSDKSSAEDWLNATLPAAKSD